MKSMNPFRALFPALILAGLGFALPAPAQDGAAKVAVANPSKILAQMQETKDKNNAEAAERANLDNQEKGKVSELQEMKKARDSGPYKSGSPEYIKATNDMQQKNVELQIWVELKKAELTRRHKEEIRGLFDKIEKAVAQVAQNKKIDLVIADYSADIPEDLEPLSVDQLHGLIRQKNVLYAGKGVDISSEVIALLDAEYLKTKK